MGTEYLAICFIIIVTIATSVPLGQYMARVFSGQRTFLDPVLLPIERLVLGIAGIVGLSVIALRKKHRRA